MKREIGQIMQVIIIGNSAAGISALEAFRKIDSTSAVTLITKEEKIPYSRVLLPYYLRGKVPYQNLFIRGEDYYSQLNAQCIKATVTRLMPDEQQIVLSDKQTLAYDKLLIATGSSPVKPPIPGLSGKDILHLWTLSDARLLATHFEPGKKIAVLGSGFVALQGAWAAHSKGLDVSVIELMPRIMPRVLDDFGATLLTDKIKDTGVDLRVNTETCEIRRTQDGKPVLHFKNTPAPLEVDVIIVGTGIQPNIDFLKGTGIKVDAGIRVNEYMETSHPGIFAAGDVAQVPYALGGPAVVHALWPTAVETGRIAGNAMAGKPKAYQGSLNMNVTQMFNTTVASMGEFMAAEDVQVWTDDTLPRDQYLKIQMKNKIPVGAVCVGRSKLITTLGLLRPLIREKVRIQGEPGQLKSLLAEKIARHHQAFAI